MGSETEYTTRLSAALDSRVDTRLVAYYADPNNLWLNNGARLYKDFGGVVEYATPEATSGLEVLLQERTGEAIVGQVADHLVHLDGSDVPVQEHVYKRTGYSDVYPTLAESKDPLGLDEENDIRIMKGNVSTGHHETYQTGIAIGEMEQGSPAARFLNTYLATRIVWTGTGLVGPERFHVSQKAEAINFRGDSLTDHGGKVPYRMKGDGLIEIRTGEGNMSDWAIATKFDMTSLVFRLIEHGDIPHKLTVMEGYETSAMRMTSRNPLSTLPSEYEAMNAIELQARIAEYALWFADKHSAVPPHEIKAARAVKSVCEQLVLYFHDHGDITTVSDRIDWAAKLNKIQSRGFTLGEVTCRNLVAVYHDLAWEDVSQDSSSRRWYRVRHNNLVTPTDINRGKFAAPIGRAATRMRIIDHYDKEVKAVDWDIITLSNDRYVVVDDPYFA